MVDRRPGIHSDLVSPHYDQKYWNWQGSLSEFAGLVNQVKFAPYIGLTDKVLDFGCGGGFLLRNLRCAERVGVEVNPPAAATARQNGLEVFPTLADVPDNYVDIIISNNALEHTLYPLAEMKQLHRVLRPAGKMILVIPCESISYAYKPKDINHHLYSWSPMCAGNLTTEAGFTLIEAQAYISKWPPHYQAVARVVGIRAFHVLCRIWGRIERSWFQVRVVAVKKG